MMLFNLSARCCLICFRYIHIYIAVLSVFALSACITVNQTIPVEDIDQSWMKRADYLYENSRWIAKMSLVGKTDEQKFKTKVIWQQKDETYQIKLQDFIGRTVAIIDGSEDAVVVKTSKGQQYKGDNAEALIKELFGMHIPVSGLRFWLQGLPQPNRQLDELMLSEEGLAESIRQQGWLMSYPYYVANDPFKMPSQVLLGIEDLLLTVKITQWEFSE